MMSPRTRLELRADYIGDPRQRALAMADLGEMSALLDDTLTFSRAFPRRRRAVHETTDIGAMVGAVQRRAQSRAKTSR